MTEQDKGLSRAESRAIERFVRGGEPASLPLQPEIPSNADAQAFARVENYWIGLDAAKDDPAVLALRAQARARLARSVAAASVSANDGEPVAGRRRGWIGPVMALAASAVMAVGIGTWVWSGRDHVGSSQNAAADRVLVNPVGPPRTWRLADNSFVTLDTDSRLTISPWKGTRSVRLDHGTAFFKVAHDPAHPFVVAIGRSRVTALGTAFAVKVSPDTTTVALSEGKVRIDMPLAKGVAEHAFLAPGKRLKINGGRWRVSELDAAQDLEWRSGLLAFDNAPLEEVVRQMNRYLVQKVELPDGGAGGRRISGSFRVDDREGFLRAIEAWTSTTRIRRNRRSAVNKSEGPPY